MCNQHKQFVAVGNWSSILRVLWNTMLTCLRTIPPEGGSAGHDPPYRSCPGRGDIPASSTSR